MALIAPFWFPLADTPGWGPPLLLPPPRDPFLWELLLLLLLLLLPLRPGPLMVLFVGWVKLVLLESHDSVRCRVSQFKSSDPTLHLLCLKFVLCKVRISSEINALLQKLCSLVLKLPSLPLSSLILFSTWLTSTMTTTEQVRVVKTFEISEIFGSVRNFSVSKSAPVPRDPSYENCLCWANVKVAKSLGYIFSFSVPL